MFDTEAEFEAYLAETKAKCPTTPEVWERVKYKCPLNGGVSYSFCSSFFRLLPNFQYRAACHKAAAKKVAEADIERLTARELTYVVPCSRSEATHVKLNNGWIVWLGVVESQGDYRRDKSPEQVAQDRLASEQPVTGHLVRLTTPVYR